MRDEIERDDTSATDWDNLRPVLDGVMRELSDRDREAILGRFFEGRAFAELGRRFALSEDAARMRVDRALDKLRALLARRGVTSTSAALGLMLTVEAAHAVPAGLATAVTGTALASATATAAGPVAAAIQFMITSKTVAGIAGAALVAAALGTAVHESRARQASAEALSAASTEAARFEAQVRDTRQRASAAELARDEAAAALAAAPAKPAAAPAPAPIDPVAAGRQFLAAHPEAKALWDERERANIATKLGPIFQVMKLGPAEREQIETIFMSTVSGVTTFGTPAGTVALKREATLTRSEAEAQMQAVLGPERYPQFVRMSALAPTFDFTVKLASALYRAEPLTPEQTGRVMQIFADASPIAKPGATTIDWNEIQQQASAVLSPTQLAGLTAVRSNFEYNQAINQLTRSANPPTR